MTTRTLVFGHSPDSDDAFLYYGIHCGAIDVPGFRIKSELHEIEQLNKFAESGRFDITALSAHGYGRVADRYFLLDAGASVARGYGPVVVSREQLTAEDLRGQVIALPGERTTAYLLARLLLPAFVASFVPFDNVESAVRRGEALAGVLIHEGQIAVEALGLSTVMDLGSAFYERFGVPVPLGVDAVRRDHGPRVAAAIASAIRDSILYARTNWESALDFALDFGRGIERAQCAKYIDMYVNDDSLFLRDDAYQGLTRLYHGAASEGLLPQWPNLALIRAS